PADGAELTQMAQQRRGQVGQILRQLFAGRLCNRPLRRQIGEQLASQRRGGPVVRAGGRERLEDRLVRCDALPAGTTESEVARDREARALGRSADGVGAQEVIRKMAQRLGHGALTTILRTKPGGIARRVVIRDPGAAFARTIRSVSSSTPTIRRRSIHY